MFAALFAVEELLGVVDLLPEESRGVGRGHRSA
jgi:hypothetical protein